jgi:CubicO group peptidase (beta-lactamase class C family)
MRHQTSHLLYHQPIDHEHLINGGHSVVQPLPLDPLAGRPQKVDILTKQVKFDCGSIDGKRVLGPQTVAFMTANHLNKDIKNNVSGTEPARVGYGFGLGVAVRTERGLSANNGNVGDYSWNGAYGTIFFVDPKEQMVVVMMSVAPGEIRKVHREKLNALIYGALEK